MLKKDRLNILNCHCRFPFISTPNHHKCIAPKARKTISSKFAKQQPIDLLIVASSSSTLCLLKSDESNCCNPNLDSCLCQTVQLKFCNKIIKMYKVGVVIMGRPTSEASKVKEIVLEVQSKTKLKNIIDYLMQINKLSHSQVYFTTEKKGRSLPNDSSVSQVLKQARPQNGVIKLYLYEQSEEESQQKIQLKHSRHEINNRSRVNPEKGKSYSKQGNTAEEKKGCCCF